MKRLVSISFLLLLFGCSQENRVRAVSVSDYEDIGKCWRGKSNSFEAFLIIGKMGDKYTTYVFSDKCYIYKNNRDATFENFSIIKIVGKEKEIEKKFGISETFMSNASNDILPHLKFSKVYIIESELVQDNVKYVDNSKVYYIDNIKKIIDTGVDFDSFARKSAKDRAVIWDMLMKK